MLCLHMSAMAVIAQAYLQQQGACVSRQASLNRLVSQEQKHTLWGMQSDCRASPTSAVSRAPERSEAAFSSSTRKPNSCRAPPASSEGGHSRGQ